MVILKSRIEDNATIIDNGNFQKWYLGQSTIIDNGSTIIDNGSPSIFVVTASLITIIERNSVVSSSS